MTEPEKEDNPAKLKREYRNTWLCTNCGNRHSVTMACCPYPPKER
jgi:hypothetical protein